MNEISPELNAILKKMSPQQRRLFACDCAEHVLLYFERFQPQDKRPRVAIEVARQFALGKATQEELHTACGDAEGAAWNAGEAAWRNLSEGEYPKPEDDAAAPAAATAEGCALANLDDALHAALATSLEVVQTAAIGSMIADRIWSGHSHELDAIVLQHYQEAEDQERAWQLAQAQRYLTNHSEIR